MKKILLFILLSGVALAQYTSQYKGSQIDSAVTAARAMYLGTATENTAPDGLDIITGINNETGNLQSMALSSLPISSAVSTALSSYVTNTVFDDTVAYFMDEIRRLELMIQEGIPRDTTINPYNVLALSSTNTASHTTGTITLTWTPPVCEFDSTRVYYSTNGIDFSYLASVDSGTNTYAHSSISPRYSAPYYYYVRPVLDGVESNLDTITNYRNDELVVSDFITKNWYISTASGGSANAQDWTNKKIYTGFTWSNANDGDTVFVDGGTDSLVYVNTGSSTISLSSSVAGTETDKIVITRGIDATHNGVPVIVAGTTSTALYVNGASNVEISYMRFRNHSSSASLSASINGQDVIYLNGSNNIDIKYCNIYNYYGTAIYADNAVNTTLLYDSIMTTEVANVGDTDGLHFEGGGGLEIGNMYMLLQNSGTSFATSGVDGHKDLLQLTNNWQTGSYATYTTKIYNSTLIHSPADTTLYGSGVYITSAGGYYEIYNNLIVSRLFGGGGMVELNNVSVSSFPAYVKVYNNTMYLGDDTYSVANKGGVAYVNGLNQPWQFLDVDSLVFKNNITSRRSNSPAMYLSPTTISSCWIDIDYNYYDIDDTTGFMQTLPGGTNYSWATWKALSTLGSNDNAPDANSTLGTITFTDTTSNATANFNVASSEGVDAGVTIAMVTDDIIGTARPQNSVYDIGAFEVSAYSQATLDYITRVEADGGTVMDTAEVEICYDAGLNMDSVLVWASPKFGVKKDANNKVTKLYDLGNGDNDFVQSDTSKSPTWYADSLVFDGVDDYMTNAFGADYSQPDMSIIAFWEKTDVSGKRYDAIASGKRRAFFDNGGATMHAGATITIVNPLTQDTDHIVTISWNSTDSSWVDGTLQGTGDAGAHVAGGITLGCAYDFGDPFKYTVYEFFYYANTGVRTIVEGIMNTRWSIY